MADCSDGGQVDRVDDEVASGIEAGDGFVVDEGSFAVQDISSDVQAGDPVDDVAVRDISQMVCISVHGRKFLIEADVIADFSQGVLDSLRVVVEGDHKFERGPNLESVMNIAGGFKRRVQGLVDLRRRVERENKLTRFNRRSRRGGKVHNHQERPSVRKSYKDLKGRGLPKNRGFLDQPANFVSVDR